MRTAITFILLLASTPARANNNELVLGTFNRSLRSDSANAVTNENLGGPQLAYGRQLHLDLVTNLQLWATGGYAWSPVQGELFGMETDVRMHQISVGGRARYMLHENVGPYARLDTGPMHTSLELTDGDKVVSDGAWGGFVSAALGIELTKAGERVGFALRFEMGYTATSSVALSPAQAAHEEMIELPASQASIGHLDLGGRFFAFSASVQF